MKNHIAAACAAFIVLLVWFGALSPIFLLIPVGCALWAISTSRPEELCSGSMRVVVFVSLLFLALLTAFAILPSHTAQNALLSANPPSGLIAATLFAGIFSFLVGRFGPLSLSGARTANRFLMEQLANRYLTIPRTAPFVWIACLGLSWVGIASLLRAVLLEPQNETPIWGLGGTRSLAAIAALGVLYPRTVASWLRNGVLLLSKIKAAAPTTCAALVLVSLIAHVKSNYAFYLANAPLQYPFASTLKDPVFHGRSFVTNNDDAAVWYFTRGWAYSSSSVLPGPSVKKGDRYFADWKNTEKYDHPDYYLCDHSRFAAKINWVSRPDGTVIRSCSEVAEYLSQLHGFRIIASTPEFSIVALR